MLQFRIQGLNRAATPTYPLRTSVAVRVLCNHCHLKFPLSPAVFSWLLDPTRPFVYAQSKASVMARFALFSAALLLAGLSAAQNASFSLYPTVDPDKLAAAFNISVDCLDAL